MHDIQSEVDTWLAQGKRVVIATVIQTWYSSPRVTGARMAITADGQIAGSVSGGCVEGAVVEVAMQVLKTHIPQLVHFGVSDESAWEIGLSCGGSIDVFVCELHPDFYKILRQALDGQQPVATVQVVRAPVGLLGEEIMVYDDGHAWISLGSELDQAIISAALSALRKGQPQRVEIPVPRRGDSIEVFIDTFQPPYTLVMVGGVQITIALAEIARLLGYRTIVVDPRRIFGTVERFPYVDRLIQSWPDEALAQVGLTSTTAVATLSHDPKLDDPALLAALPSTAFYVGALGSSRTQAKRRQRLLEGGLDESLMARLHTPIGLSIGAQNPEEIALAIMAQITAVRRGREM